MKLFRLALPISIFFLTSPVFAREAFQGIPASPDMNPFLDPGFQDYAETSYGYLNKQYAPGPAADFRDSLTDITVAAMPPAPLRTYQQPLTGSVTLAAGREIAANTPQSGARPGQYYKVTFAGESGPISAWVSPLDQDTVSGFNAGSYVFMSVLPKAGEDAAVTKALSEYGFQFAGEKISVTDGERRARLLGWAPYSKIERIYKNPLVLRVAVERKNSEAPFRTGIRFTLRAPGGGSSEAFVEDFLRALGSTAGFSYQTVFRLPKNPGNSKFTAFDITGSLPADMVNAVFLSPFVAAMEFQDKSL